MAVKLYHGVLTVRVRRGQDWLVGVGRVAQHE